MNNTIKSQKFKPKEKKFDPPFIPNSVLDNRSSFAVPIWREICKAVGKEGYVKRKEIAESVGTSTVTVWKVLKGFQRCKLVEIESFNGPGQGIHLKNLWLVNRPKIKERFVWKLGYEAEKEYLRNLDINSDSTGVKSLDYISNSRKSTLRTKTVEGISPKRKKTKKTSTTEKKEKRKEILDSVDDDTVLEKNRPYYRFFMEQVRDLCWKAGAERKISDIIGDTVGLMIDGRKMRFARELLSWLAHNVKRLIRKLESIFGLRRLYSLASRIIRKGLGLLKSKNGSHLPSNVDGDTWDLRSQLDRKNFEAVIEKIVKNGDGICPRCEKEINWQIFDNPLRFYDRGKCRCVYVSRSKRLEEIERKKAKFFGEKSPSNAVQDRI